MTGTYTLRRLLIFTGLMATTGDLRGQQAENYRYFDYGEIVERLRDLERQHPALVRLYSAQDEYKLPTVEQYTESKKPLCGKDFCQQWIVRVTNEATLGDRTNNEATRPQVFFSGALHGNERVGPVVVLELIAMLVDDYHSDPWIKRLVDTRQIFAMPMPNAVGYYENTREENEIDANRDFPYLRSGKDCMRTITGRSIDELWRQHIFQVAITFHGGMVAMAYEWGGPNHPSPQDESPDEKSQSQTTAVLSAVAGKFHSHSGPDGYPAGRLNSLVYPVNGGMEDWAYAGSWENQLGEANTIGQCKPKEYGGYATAETEYADAALRAFNLLIEISDVKTPNERELGGRLKLLEPGSADDGWVPRNMRAALAMIDLVQPYVELLSMQGTAQPGEVVLFSWMVGGAVWVNETTIELFNAATAEAIVVTPPIQAGPARWGHSIRWRNMTAGPRAHFSAKVRMPERSSRYQFRVRARVDQQWAMTGDTEPKVAPQSHLANARTNSHWHMANGPFHVDGQLDWYSQTAAIEVESIQQLDVQSVDAASGPSDDQAPIRVAVLVFGALIITTVLAMFGLFGRTARRRSRGRDDDLEMQPIDSDDTRESTGTTSAWRQLSGQTLDRVAGRMPVVSHI